MIKFHPRYQRFFKTHFLSISLFYTKINVWIYRNKYEMMRFHMKNNLPTARALSYNTYFLGFFTDVAFKNKGKSMNKFPQT